MRRTVAIAVGLVSLSLAFCWGAVTITHRIFPFGLIEAAARSAGFAQQRTDFTEARTNRTDSRTLSTLGYLHSAPDANPSATGVTIHDETRAYPGLNFYNESESDTVRLIDMDGNLVHEWTYAHPSNNLHHAELLPNGDVLLTQQNYEVARLDASSRVLWRRQMTAHHDLSVNKDGSIWVIGRRTEIVPEFDASRAITYDTLVHLTGEGELIEEFSLLDILLDSPYRFLLPMQAPQADAEESAVIDLLHTNHVEELDGSSESLSPLLAKGNLLISMRHINTILILDGTSHRILWLWGPTNVGWQHQPQVLSSGRILLFDNGFDESRVIEIDMPSGSIAWEYRDGEGFFSSWGGASQRLPNGNTLITETASGYAFEVTSDGEKVWEFANPHLEENGTRRVNIWRMKRFERENLTFLN